MKFRNAFLFLMLAGFSVGCSSDPGLRSDPTDISGIVTFSDGKPVKDVRLNIFPTNSKHQPASFDLKADGKFTVKLIPGNYTFAFEPTGNGAGFKAIPPTYQTNSADHTLQVEAGKELTIQVTK